MSIMIKTERSWGAALFGTFFAVPATLIFALSTIPNLHDAYRMQAWASAQATLSASEIKYYSGKTTTYKATATYHYQTDEGRYQGSRVSIHSGSDNLGDYHI